MKRIVLNKSRELHPSIEHLRLEHYPGKWEDGQTGDEFDAASWHLTAWIEGVLVGAMRLTPQPPSFYAGHIEDHTGLLFGPHVIEANRAVISTNWRGLGLYKLLMAEATLVANELGYSAVAGVVTRDFPLLGFLEQIGYERVSDVHGTTPSGVVQGYYLVQDPGISMTAAVAVQSEVAANIAAKGLLIERG